MAETKSNTKLETPDINEERLELLKQHCPDWFTQEGELDIDEVKKAVNPEAVKETERFEFTWFGKAQAKRKAFTPSNATLKYDEDRSVNPTKSDGNLIIEGENLEVLKLLLSSYREKVKCIYIDPPYNKGDDRVYQDNFKETNKEYWEKTGQTEDGVKIDTNYESDGRYHSNWLNMMLPRLILGRQLLKENGVIFVSIDDDELVHLRKLLNIVFGESNFLAQFVHKNNSIKNQANHVSVSTEYCICYCKNIDTLKGTKWRVDKKGASDVINMYKKLKRKGESLPEILAEVKEMYSRPKYSHLSRWNNIDDKGIFVDADLSRKGGPKDYTIKNPETGKDCKIPSRGWGKSYEELLKLQEKDLIYYGSKNTPPRMKDYLDTDSEVVPDNFWYFDNSVDTRMIKEMFGSLVFDNPKPLNMLKRLLNMTREENDIILDFFAGSGTSGQAILDSIKEDKNRKFILVQYPEKPDKNTQTGKNAIDLGYKKISDITIDRLKNVIEGYGDNPEPINSGFKVYTLSKSNFPRVEFSPDPEKAKEENVATLKEYIAKKEASMQTMFNEQDIIDEVLLKNGFMLDYNLSEQGGFEENEVYLAEDKHREALICLNDELSEKTVEHFKDNDELKFICLERALDTSKKWNLKRYLGDRLNAM